jgi:AAA domain-containing protein
MHGFVPALTSFVGREEDVAEAAALLSEYRLVTVTGPGGMGKTRLAGEVARQVAARFADGTWLVELAAVRDPGQVAASVAAALGVPNVPGRPLTETLATVLGRQQALLVLDNCEHLLVAVAEMCSHDWCLAQFWLGDIGPAVQSLGRETAALEVLGAQAPSPLLAEMLAARSRTLTYLGRLPEAAADAHAALAVARQIAYPAGEVLALAQLSRTADFAGDPPGALQWARLAQRILAAPENGWTLRFTGNFVSEILIESGDTAAARRSIADGLAWAREAGDLLAQAG